MSAIEIFNQASALGMLPTPRFSLTCFFHSGEQKGCSATTSSRLVRTLAQNSTLSNSSCRGDVGDAGGRDQSPTSLLRFSFRISVRPHTG